MEFQFFKYQGTGNDFVVVDNRQNFFPKNDTNFIAHLCDRKFGIGADGLLLLEEHKTLDFTMVYYNADGNASSMCGNGGRCLVHFAHFLGIVSEQASFEAVDGVHKATIFDTGMIALQMQNVSEIDVASSHCFLDTGSPHHVQEETNLETFDVIKNGASLRHNLYGTAGANINFVEQKSEDTFAVRTYERGVENETLSCGTGVTAVAIAMHITAKTKANPVILQTPGGELSVSFMEKNGVYSDVFLKGPAIQVFKGTWK